MMGLEPGGTDQGTLPPATGRSRMLELHALQRGRRADGPQAEVAGGLGRPC